MAGVNLEVAHDARAIAATLIRDHHPHLADAEILYIFTDQRRKRCDRVRLGSAAKMNALQRFLASGLDGVNAGPHFVILIYKNEWRDFTTEQRQALIDHELFHCAVFVKLDQKHGDEATGWVRWDERYRHWEDCDEWRYGMRGHDIEEFAEVVRRYGFWKHDPRELEFKAIAIQLAIPER